MVTRTDFATIVPVLIVTLSACAVLLAEALRRKGERMPSGVFGLIGLAGAASHVDPAVGAQPRPDSASSSPTTSRCSSMSCCAASAC